MATNTKRQCSEYIYELSGARLERLLELAIKKDQAIQTIVLEAIDQYIWRQHNERNRTVPGVGQR